MFRSFPFNAFATLRICAASAVVSCCCACAPLAYPPQDSQNEPDVFRYTIQYQGQTITHIASWYTGKQSNWSKIMAHNPGMEPRRLKVGDTVVIPSAMLVRRDAFPKSRLKMAASKLDERSKQKMPAPPVSVLKTTGAKTTGEKATGEKTTEELKTAGVSKLKSAAEPIVTAKAETAAAAQSASEAIAETPQPAKQAIPEVEIPAIARIKSKQSSNEQSESKQPEAKPAEQKSEPAADAVAESPAANSRAQLSSPAESETTPSKLPAEVITGPKGAAAKAKPASWCDGIGCVLNEANAKDADAPASPNQPSR